MFIKPPITVDDNGDVTVYAKVGEAESTLEPSDLDDERQLTVYDASGRVWRLVADPQWPLGADRIGLRPGDDPPHPDRLAAVLRQFLSRVGSPVSDSDSLETLLPRVQRFQQGTSDSRQRLVRSNLLVASIALLVLGVLAGIGAPPSAFAPHGSVWRSLDPLMWPGLFGGVILGVLAVVASAIPVIHIKVAATFCFLASLLTILGVISAFGISDHHGLGFYGVTLALVGLPGAFAFRQIL